MIKSPSDPDRHHRDAMFERRFDGRPNRAVIKRQVIPGEATMRSPPAAWAIITPDYPQGISPEVWQELPEDEKTEMALFWYISNYTPVPGIGPHPQGWDRSAAAANRESTAEFTNMTEYIHGMFGQRSLALVGVSVESRLHSVSREWQQTERLEIITNDEELEKAIQRAAVGVKHAYAEVQRASNAPPEVALKIPEMRELIDRVGDIVTAVEERDREEASKRVGWVSSVAQSFGKGLAEYAGKRTEAALAPYIMTLAIPLYHSLVEFVHYVGQFIGNLPFG
jgi:hypothetical protein